MYYITSIAFAAHCNKDNNIIYLNVNLALLDHSNIGFVSDIWHSAIQMEWNAMGIFVEAKLAGQAKAKC